MVCITVHRTVFNLNYKLIEHATVLTSSDVKEMFMRLSKIFGSKSKAAQKCGIERTGFYDWEKASDLRLKTKMKVLSVMFEEVPEDALTFVFTRSKELTLDVFKALLETLYEWALNKDASHEEFQTYTDHILAIYEKNPGLVLFEIEKMSEEIRQNLKEKSETMSINFPSRSIDLIKSRNLVELLPSLIQVISAGEVTNEEIAYNLDIPLNFIHKLSDTLSDVLSFTVKKPKIGALLQKPMITVGLGG